MIEDIMTHAIFLLPAPHCIIDYYCTYNEVFSDSALLAFLLVDGSANDKFLLDKTRRLQQPALPDYTSPPTDFALACTPEAYRSDKIIDKGRDAAANNTCFEDPNVCQIPFVPPISSPRIGVVFHNGALVDPRAYSPICKQLAERYGIAVALQIYKDDLPFALDSCNTNRTQLASLVFPTVEKWTLAGHSMGGIAAMADAWSSQDSTIGGLALLGSYVRQDVGCGEIDFFRTKFPMASVNASLDLVINQTNFVMSQSLLSENDTFYMEVMGGNHQQFGSYDNSERQALLGQVDGNASIPETIRLDLSIAAIAHVASRIGIPFPEMNQEVEQSATSKGGRRITGVSFGAFLIAATTALLSSF